MFNKKMTLKELREAAVAQGVPLEAKMRKIGHNTALFAWDGQEALLYTKTVIVRKRGEQFKLYMEGWDTMNTRNRIDEYLRPFEFRMFKHCGQTRVGRFPKGFIWGSKGEVMGVSVAFYEGMTLTFGKDPRYTRRALAFLKRQERLEQRIKKYVEGLRGLKELPMLEPGDCFYCQGIVQELGKDMKPTGRDMRDSKEHLLAHFREKYYVGSLVLNAFRSAGCGNLDYIKYKWEKGRETWDGRDARKQVGRLVSKYLRKCFGLSV